MRIRVIDIETSSDGPGAGVCEIGWIDVVNTNTDLIGHPCGWEIRPGGATLVSPSVPIAPGTSAVHHIIDEDVRGAPTLAQAWKLVTAMPEGKKIDAFAAHAAKFERIHITDEMTRGLPWLCTYKCALRIWQDAPSHSNQALRYWRKPAGLDRALASPAHRAGPDAYVTAHHLRDLLGLAPLEALLKWSSEPALQITCHMGKQRGSKWTEVDSGFLYWVMKKVDEGADFDEDVIFTVRHELERRRKLEAADAAQENTGQDAGIE